MNSKKKIGIVFLILIVAGLLMSHLGEVLTGNVIAEYQNAAEKIHPEVFQ